MGQVAGEIEGHTVDLFIAGWISQEANPERENLKWRRFIMEHPGDQNL